MLLNSSMVSDRPPRIPFCKVHLCGLRSKSECCFLRQKTIVACFQDYYWNAILLSILALASLQRRGGASSGGILKRYCWSQGCWTLIAWGWSYSFFQTARKTQKKGFFCVLLPLHGPSETLLMRKLTRFSFVTNNVKVISCKEKVFKKQNHDEALIKRRLFSQAQDFWRSK